MSTSPPAVAAPMFSCLVTARPTPIGPRLYPICIPCNFSSAVLF